MKLITGGTHELSEIYASLESELTINTVFRNLMNGTLNEKASSSGIINIPKLQLKNPVIRDYDIKKGLEAQQSETEILQIVITKNKCI